MNRGEVTALAGIGVFLIGLGWFLDDRNIALFGGGICTAPTYTLLRDTFHRLFS